MNRIRLFTTKTFTINFCKLFSGTRNITRAKDYRAKISHKMPDMSKKTRLAFWIVSHCETDNKREDYAKKLQEYMPVDIYGKCGPLNCSQGINGYLSLAPIYKFYLAFENSNCYDYFTEKFTRTLGQNVVPIVMGGADYKAFAPEMSFIDTLKGTRDPKDLTELLIFLDENDDKYLEYFEWIHKTAFYKRNHFCQLCHKLNNVPSLFKKTYTNITDWWLHDNKNQKVCDV